jgi:hypothetical protein
MRKLLVDLRMQGHRRLDRSLGVKFRRKGNLEQHVFHHVAAEGLRLSQGFGLEQHVLEAPGLRREGGRIAHLALEREQRVAHRAAGRIAGRPALARPRVRRVPIGAQGAAVDPGVRDGIDDLIPGAAEQRRDHGGRGDANQQHMVEPDPVEAVLEREHALNLVCLDHAGEHVAHGNRLAAA